MARNWALETPALNGEIVMQGHADYCAANGHLQHTIDGELQPMCPRCGYFDADVMRVVIEPTPLDKNGRPVTASTPLTDFTNAQLEGIVNGQVVKGDTTLTRYLAYCREAAAVELAKRHA